MSRDSPKHEGKGIGGSHDGHANDKSCAQGQFFAVFARNLSNLLTQILYTCEEDRGSILQAGSEEGHMDRLSHRLEMGGLKLEYYYLRVN